MATSTEVVSVARFTAVVVAQRPYLLVIAARRVGAADAEDVVQAALAQAWRALPRFHGTDEVLAHWLTRITARAALDQWRHDTVPQRDRRVTSSLSPGQLRGRDQDQVAALAAAETCEEAVLRREAATETHDRVVALLARCTPRQRQALWLLCAQGRPLRWVAAQWGVDWTAVKGVRTRAMRKLRATRGVVE
jgi:RNA polymerase sigma factor (sigma-70 family)